MLKAKITTINCDFITNEEVKYMTVLIFGDRKMSGCLQTLGLKGGITKGHEKTSGGEGSVCSVTG